MPIKPEEEVKQYIHEEQKRANNPPVGIVSAENDPLNKKKLTSLTLILILSFNGLEKLKV